jgi:hypothetical protein
LSAPAQDLCGLGQKLFKEEKMQDQEPLTVRPKRLFAPKPTFKPYGVPRYRLTLVAESSGLEPSGPIQTSIAAATLLRPCFKGLDREQFLVCGLDAKHRIIGINIVSIGSLTLAIVHPREVFKPLSLVTPRLAQKTASLLSDCAMARTYSAYRCWIMSS